MTSSPATEYVFIVGRGGAPLGCAATLWGGGNVRATRLHRHNHHPFQPMGRRLASSLLALNDVSVPSRRILRERSNIHMLLYALIHRTRAKAATPSSEKAGSEAVAPDDTAGKLTLAMHYEFGGNLGKKRAGKAGAS